MKMFFFGKLFLQMMFWIRNTVGDSDVFGNDDELPSLKLTNRP